MGLTSAASAFVRHFFCTTVKFRGAPGLQVPERSDSYKGRLSSLWNKGCIGEETCVYVFIFMCVCMCVSVYVYVCMCM